MLCRHRCVHGLGQRSASGILPLSALLIFPEGSIFVSFPIAPNPYSDKSSLEEKVQSGRQGLQGGRSLKQLATLDPQSTNGATHNGRVFMPQ